MISRIIIGCVGVFIGYTISNMTTSAPRTSAFDDEFKAIKETTQKIEAMKDKVVLTTQTDPNQDKQLLSLMNAQTKTQQLAVEYGNLCKINPSYCPSRDQLLANVKTLSADVVAFQKSMTRPTTPTR